MKMTEEMRKQIIARRRKVWITAIFITIALVMITAYIMQWIVGLFNVKLTIGQSVVITIIANLVVGFIKGLQYAKSKSKTK